MVLQRHIGRALVWQILYIPPVTFEYKPVCRDGRAHGGRVEGRTEVRGGAGIRTTPR